MLINYSFSNFRSFKNQTSLSMKAGTQRTLNENLIKHDGIRILPSSVIYGANASGKSNIIMSLAIMRDIVLAGSVEANISSLSNLELYPFAHINDEKPMIFEIEFIHKGYHMIYKLEIMCTLFERTSRRVNYESLSVIDKNLSSIKLFERNSNSIFMIKDKKALKILKFDEKLLKEFEKRINNNLDPAELFLSRAFKSIISSELAEIVIEFFKDRLIVVSDFSLKKMSLSFCFDDIPKKDFIIWNRILEGFQKNADFGPQTIAFKPNASDPSETTDMELVSIYKNEKHAIMIPAELMESRGTLKLLDFAVPFDTLFTSGGVFVLDEFDSAIHPELIKGILALFNDQTVNKNNSQLIFTTHNPIYLNNKIFRRDQILFVEKDKDTFESVIYSLADFGSDEVRNDHNYLINYFRGNYGALPFIDFSRLLVKSDEEED